MPNRYYLSAKLGSARVEREVTLEEFCRAERAAGFRPKMPSSDPRYMTTPATGGFGSDGISGHVRWEPDAAGVAEARDCGEAGHAEGRCGNVQCLRGADKLATQPTEPTMPDADVQDESGLLTYYSKDALAEYAQAWRDTFGVPEVVAPRYLTRAEVQVAWRPDAVKFAELVQRKFMEVNGIAAGVLASEQTSTKGGADGR